MGERAETIAVKPGRARSPAARARRTETAASDRALQSRVDEMLTDLRRRAELRLASAEALFRRAGG